MSGPAIKYRYMESILNLDFQERLLAFEELSEYARLRRGYQATEAQCP